MSELKGACIIGQSGGPTSVINASAYGVIRTALELRLHHRAFYGAEHGIKGVLADRLFDMSKEDRARAGAAEVHPLLRARLLPLQARRSRCGRHRL